jgi:hypothetical protein
MQSLYYLAKSIRSYTKLYDKIKSMLFCAATTLNIHLCLAEKKILNLIFIIMSNNTYNHCNMWNHITISLVTNVALSISVLKIMQIKLSTH